MMLIPALCAVMLTPPHLMRSTHDGIVMRENTMANTWQLAPTRLPTPTAQILARYWATPDFSRYYEDDLVNACPIEEGWSFMISLSWNDTDYYVFSTPGLLLHFSAIDAQNGGAGQAGVWIGPADYDFDGSITSADFFAFLNDFLTIGSDYNLDGALSSADLFQFIEDFLQ